MSKRIWIYPIRWHSCCKHRDTWGELYKIIFLASFEVLRYWPHHPLRYLLLTNTKRFNFKSNYCPPLALSSTNKSYIYPIWHTASSNDTTKSYSQWIRTPQPRTLLKQRDKISNGISKRQFSLTSFSYLCKCSPELLNHYHLNFFHECRDVHVICTAYVWFPMKSRCRKLT